MLYKFDCKLPLIYLDWIFMYLNICTFKCFQKFNPVFSSYYPAYYFVTVNIDTWLENMLLLVKNSIARTKTAIDLNITGRSLGLQIFGNRDPLSTELRLSYQNM